MKIVTWNVRGICSSSNRCGMWNFFIIKQWDVLCAVERKEHAKFGSPLQHRQYHVFYARATRGLCSSVMLAVKDSIRD